MISRTTERVTEFVVVVGVEIFLFYLYLSGDGTFHYFTHFFAGATLALVLMTLAARHWRRPVRFPLLMVLIGHLLAMAPDIAFVEDLAHGRWEDVFVAHNISHFVPGRNVTWYLLFLAGLTLYLVAAPQPPGVAPHKGRESGDEQPQMLQTGPRAR